MREEQRWLLIADLADSSDLSKTMPATQLALIVGEWLAAATELRGAHGGRINKYMGDGFLASWRDQPVAVATALAGSLVLPFLLSPAARDLAPHLALLDVPGRYELKGFPSAEGLGTLV